MTASLFGPNTAQRVSAIAAISAGGQESLAHHALSPKRAAPKPGPVDDSSIATPIPYSVPLITWPAPAPITYGTPLDGVEFDASVTFSGIIVPGLITYPPSSGTILHAGANQELLAGFVPSVQNFSGATGSVLLTVNPGPTTLSLTASPVPLGAGGPITLTAAISTTVTGVSSPVGSVTFTTVPRCWARRLPWSRAAHGSRCPNTGAGETVDPFIEIYRLGGQNRLVGKHHLAVLTGRGPIVHVYGVARVRSQSDRPV